MLSGKVLGKRYRIGERIGGGGMAVVYRADDIMLGRTVAVKVLRSQFATDDEFIRRFRREAQSVASLSHPGIVSIYDVGEDQGLHYIVMELVEGETLKQLVDREAPLPPAQVASVAMQILDAVEAAHQRRIVHRDIKPHNILITRDGRVKVTDFGIARATGMDTQTNTGSIMGSAHYFSPEQARGTGVGEKSDLYSVGIVLYEMATGAVPFQGESPISVALKHVQDEVTPAGRLNAQVPVELDEIILRALEKDPEDRFESAGNMRTALARFKEDLLAGRTHQGAGEFPTQDLRALRNAALAQSQAKKGGRKPVAANKQKGGGALFWRLGIGALVVLVLVGLGIYGYSKFMAVWVVEDVTVPPVVGLTVEEATRQLKTAGLQGQVAASHEDPTKPANTVLFQAPVPNTQVKKGRIVDLTISAGAKTVQVPNLINLSTDAAIERLKKEGLILGDMIDKPDDRAQGTVVDQAPLPGIQLNTGAKVSLTISQGPLSVSVVGLPLDQAKRKLEESSLRVGTIKAQASTFPVNLVLAQDPKSNDKLKAGDSVNLVVSAGPDTAPPDPVPVPPTPPQQNPDGSKTVQAMIEVRAASGTFQVIVQLTDDTGKKQRIYSGKQTAGQSFPLPITYKNQKGPAEYLVFLNDERFGYSYSSTLP